MRRSHQRTIPAPNVVASNEAAQLRHDELMRVYRDAQTQSHQSADAGGIASHDLAVLRRNFQFIRDDEADLERGETNWEVRMSVRYYRKLFREYALADLSRYKEGKVGLRWRTEMELVVGKGQFVCGNKTCDERQQLHSYELLFAYVEHGHKKRCLVKVRVCEACARKLFYRKLKENDKKLKRAAKRVERKSDTKEGRDQSKRSRKRSRSGSDSSNTDRSPRNRTKKVKSHNQSIHSLCAAINSAENIGIIFDGGAKEESADKEEAAESETNEFTKLLL